MMLLFLVIAFWIRSTCAYIEYVEVSGCENCAILLTCRHLDSVIAVYGANFRPYDTFSPYYDEFSGVFPPDSPRLALNRRCSGVNHCSFILMDDCPGADRWGPGNFNVTYACISDRHITKYCNENITLPSADAIGISEGFIQNPGYPKFYLGNPQCTWWIKAPPMQKVQITLLDLSLIGSRRECSDLLEIKETENVVFAGCAEQEPPTKLISIGDSFEVSLTVAEDLVARRGILLHYAALGCVTLEAPNYGYLIQRNDTHASYTCCVGFRFANGQRNAQLTCTGHRWNRTLEKCIKIPEGENLIENARNQTKMSATNQGTISDVLVPSMIILVLFVVNTIVLVVIYRYKKRKQADLVYSEEELGTIALRSPVEPASP